MLPIRPQKAEQAAGGIFCCAAATPVISYGADKLHQDPNRDFHDAIFHSFMGFALRTQRKATLWAIAASHLEQGGSPSPWNGLLPNLNPLLISALPLGSSQSVKEPFGPESLAITPENNLLPLTNATQSPIVDPSPANPLISSGTIAPTKSTSQALSFDKNKVFVPQNNTRGSLPPGLAATLAERNKREAQLTIEPDHRFSTSRFLNQPHPNLSPSVLATDSTALSLSTKTNSPDKEFTELELLEKKIQDLLFPSQTLPKLSRTAQGYFKGTVPSSSQPTLVGISTPSSSSLQPSECPITEQTSLVKVENQVAIVPATSLNTASLPGLIQPLQLAPTFNPPTLPVQTSLVGSPGSNYEQLCNNPLTAKSAYVIHLTSRVDFGPVYSHRYFICPTNLEEDWIEVSKLQWWAQGEPFKYKAEKWDFKCLDHSNFFRMTLRPNLSLRDTEPKLKQ